MLKLGDGLEWLGSIPSNDAKDDRPFLLPGVRVGFLPIGRKAVRAAREAVGKALGIDPDDMQEASDALTEELLRRGISAWEGVGDKEGQPVAVTPEWVERFIANPFAFEAAQAVYVDPWTVQDLEKNGSAGSPDGIGTKATPENDTAPSAAPQSGKGVAKNARTSRTSRPRRPAKQSGAS